MRAGRARACCNELKGSVRVCGARVESAEGACAFLTTARDTHSTTAPLKTRRLEASAVGYTRSRQVLKKKKSMSQTKVAQALFRV